MERYIIHTVHVFITVKVALNWEVTSLTLSFIKLLYPGKGEVAG